MVGTSFGSYNDVEPDLTMVGSTVSVVVDISFICPGASMCQTVCYKKSVTTDVQLNRNMGRVTLFQVEVQHCNGRIWLLATPDTSILAHETRCIENVKNVVELCSGIGAVSKGYQRCGGKTICFCDHNERYCNWIRKRMDTPVVCGDISNDETVAEIAKHCKGATHSLSSGVSCQPFSTLGDQKHQADQRSISLPATLKTAVLLQSSMVFIECTRTAGDSDWVKGLLDQFCKATGFRMAQRTLNLHKSWPTKRTRWWCVLSHPSLPAPRIDDLPEVRFEPSVMHLISTMLSPPQGKEHEIELIQPEVYGFSQSKGGLQSHVLNACFCMPTATHSWGSQLCSCKCGCRQNGFSNQRITDKGLYAVLVPTGKMDSKADTIFRHLLPQEVALFNGLPPSYVQPRDEDHLRLELSGVGQIASPLQSGWIMANLLHDMQESGMAYDVPHPRKVFANMCRDLLDERDQVWDVQNPNKYMKIFRDEVEAIDRPWIFSNHDEIEEIDGPLTQEIHSFCKTLSDLEQEPTGFEDPADLSIRVCASDNRGKGKGGVKVHQDASSFRATDDISVRNCIGKGEYNHNGGVPGFETKQNETKKRKFEHQQDGKPIGFVNQEVSHEPVATRKEDSNSKHAEQTVFVTIWINETGENIHPIKVAKGATIGQIVQAERTLKGNEVGPRPTNGVGHQLSIHAEVTHEQIVCMEPDINKVYRCPKSFSDCCMPDIRMCDRLQGLWNQKGWVAVDEMSYYLESIVQSDQSECSMAPIVLQHQLEESLGKQFKNGLIALIQKVKDIPKDKNQKGFTAVLHDKHWVPVIISIENDDMQIETCANFVYQIQKWCEEEGDCDELQVQGCYIPHVFNADCGFQTIAWLSARAKGQDGLHPIQPEDAEELRYAFAKYLEQTDRADSSCKDIQLGGTSDTSVQQQLQNLLEEHGVAKSRVESCSQHLIRVLGTPSISSTLASPKPWKDLKTKASQTSPPTQIVLAEELKVMIDKRIAQGTVFGKKQQKKQEKNTKRTLCIDASKVHVPSAIFQQQDGKHLQQISTRQIVQGCQGVAIVNIDDAIPFFQLNEPISNEGVGLLILDFADERIPDRHDKVCFPATCPGTEEPVLLTAALFQLGRKGVGRVIPKERSKVEETPTRVYRLVMYRDQCQMEWDAFVSKPVKHILEHEACQSFTTDTIVDVWDRQFLTKQFTRCKPQEASMFMVTIRMQQEGDFQFHDESGVEGIFIEPRTNCGRKPAEGFQVVWLPKKTHGEVIVARQVLPHASWIVRHGDRFGLRVNDADAKATHEQHRPDLGFLGGNELVNYRIGPLPFGTTKKSLIKLFAEWGWNARPSQPVGQTKDHSGLFWAVQASHQPSHWVFTMEHGDILISTIPNHKEASGSNAGLIVASKRTFAAITNRQMPTNADRHSQDPLQTNDPWAKFVASGVKTVTPTQMAQIETNVQRKVVEVLQSKTGEDVNMDSAVDGRVTQLEDQVKKLTDNFAAMNSNITNFQQQQQHINGQIAGQMQGIKTQVDKQHSTMQTLLESKMEEQMSRIEALLTKRAKTGE